MEAANGGVHAVRVDDDSKVYPRCAERHHVDPHIAEGHESAPHGTSRVPDSRADYRDDSPVSLDRNVAQPAQIHQQSVEARRVVYGNRNGDLGGGDDVDGCLVTLEYLEYASEEAVSKKHLRRGHLHERHSTLARNCTHRTVRRVEGDSCSLSLGAPRVV